MRLTVYFLNKEFILVFLEGFILSLGGPSSAAEFH